VSRSSFALLLVASRALTAAFSAVETLFTQQTGTCITDVAAGSVSQGSAGSSPAAGTSDET
jgi:ABC-type molybdate transport system substrate-binding protein